MLIELIKSLGSLSIVFSVIYIITCFIFSVGLRSGIEYFKAFDLSFSKFMGGYAIFVFGSGVLFQFVIQTNTMFYAKRLIYILISIYFIFTYLLSKRRDKYLNSDKDYIPNGKVYTVLAVSVNFILFIAGYIMAGTSFEFKNISDNTSVFIIIYFVIGYIISLLSCGYILSYANTFNFKKYSFYSNKLNEFDFFGKLSLEKTLKDSNLKYRKITGYLIEENNESLTIKTCRPDDLRIISIKKSLIDLMTIES